MVTPPAERGVRYQSPEVETAFLTLRSATLPPWEGGREGAGGLRLPAGL